MVFFLRDPNSYIRQFRRKPRKIPNAAVRRQARPGIEFGTSHQPVLIATASPLVGLAFKGFDYGIFEQILTHEIFKESVITLTTFLFIKVN